MAKKRILNPHSYNDNVKKEKRFEKPTELETLTIQGQDEDLGKLDAKLRQGLRVNGEYRVIYHDDNGNVNWDQIPDISAKQDVLSSMTESRNRIQQELDDYSAQLEHEKAEIEQKARHRAGTVDKDGNPVDKSQQEATNDDQTTN